MLIDGHTIRQELLDGNWKAWREDQQVWPDSLSIGPNSIDLTLCGETLFPRITQEAHSREVDPVDEPRGLRWQKEVAKDGKIRIRAGQFMLGAVRERFDVAKPVLIDKNWWCAVPMFEGRSTVARLGLAVHISASYGNYGFQGAFTMEMVNLGPMDLVLTVGMKIAQLSFQATSTRVQNCKYNSAYDQRAGGPQAPILGRERFML